MNTQCAGLIFDESSHYLDHLAPLCALLQWPLIVCEPSLAELCERFYPMTTVIPTDFSQLNGLLSKSAFESKFDDFSIGSSPPKSTYPEAIGDLGGLDPIEKARALIEMGFRKKSNLSPCIVGCDTRPLLDLALGPTSSWKGRYIWLPHGQSDKGWKSPYFEALGAEDLLLVYGNRMREVLRAKNIGLPQISVGNFRWQFYQLHKTFYDRLMDQQFGQQRFVLYAPTWDDSEQNGSFWTAFESLIRAVPLHLHLLIKVHPNMQKTAPAKIERCRGMIEGMNNISFLDDFPPIYPLLDRTDTYIGDMSSIGYDYLRFSRPMFFLTDKKVDPENNPSAYLMQYGTQVLYEEIPELFGRRSSLIKPYASWAFDEIPHQVLHQFIHRWATT